MAGLSGYWNLKTHGGLKSRHIERDEREEGKKDVSPVEWHKWFMKGRRTLDGRSPAVHRQEAKAWLKRLPMAVPGNASGLDAKFPKSPCNWSELGPKPQTDGGSGSYGKISGRVTSLALDLTNDPTGNTLYLGGAYGGVWKSTNALSGSPSFSFLSDPTQSLAVGAIAVDASHPTTYLYVGTGEANMSGDSYYGVGILKSTDDGGSWTLVSTANSGAISFLGLTFSKIVVDPVNPNIVMAGAVFGCCDNGLNQTNMGLYRSTDSGATWTQVPDSNVTFNVSGAQFATHSCTDLIYESSSGTYYAGTRGEGIFKSTDQGATWTQLTSPLQAGVTASLTNFARVSLASRGVTLWALACDSSAAPSASVTGGTGLAQSNDGGTTWAPVNLPGGLFNAGAGSQGDYDQYVMAPAGGTALVVAGIDAFRASSANGTSTSWTNLTNSYGFSPASHPDQHAFVAAASVTWFIGNDGGVWSTTNSGTNLTDINSNLATIQFYSASPDPNHAGSYSGGSQDNGTAYTNNSSGVTWTQVLGGDGGYTDFNASVPGELFAENYNVGLYRSANNGTDNFPFTVVDSTKIPDNSAFYVPYKVIPGVPGQVVLGASHVWRGAANANNGSGWVSISQNLLGADSGFVVALDTGTSNANYIYATTEDDSTGQYHVFGNGGASGASTWSDITGTLPKTSPIAGIAVDPTAPTTLYVGVQGFVGSAGVSHVYQSTNGGTSWTDITGNLPDAPVNWILVDPVFNTDIYVANDVGVFYTNSVSGGSTSWSRVGTALPDSTVLQIKMGACPNRTLVAATHGRGAWAICPISNHVCPSPTFTPTVTQTFTPTVTFTPTNTPVSVPFAAQAQPNVTDGNTVVNFAVGLPNPMTMTLAIYNVADEAVYAQSFAGNTGQNSIPWKPQNQNGQPLASGVYIYHLRVDDGSNHYDKVGKILVRP